MAASRARARACPPARPPAGRRINCFSSCDNVDCGHLIWKTNSRGNFSRRGRESREIKPPFVDRCSLRWSIKSREWGGSKWGVVARRRADYAAVLRRVKRHTVISCISRERLVYDRSRPLAQEPRVAHVKKTVISFGRRITNKIQILRVVTPYNGSMIHSHDKRSLSSTLTRTRFSRTRTKNKKKKE